MGSTCDFCREGNALPTTDCQPIDVAPGLSRLFIDFCAGAPAVQPFFASLSHPQDWQTRPPFPEHWAGVVAVLAAQNPSAATANALEALRDGAGAVVTGQQVGLFGGPLFTPFKAATALARARQATASGRPHAAIFWLATEDHDFAEINQVTFPARKELQKLVYSQDPSDARAGWRHRPRRLNRSADWSKAWELLVRPTPWTHWSRPTSPAAHLLRPSPISTRRHSPRRDC